MIEDRDYMRQPDYGQSGWRSIFRLRWSWTTVLIAAYIMVLLADEITARFFPAAHVVFRYLALSRAGVFHGYEWQFITYQFMHAGWLHLLFNCWAIFMFGNELEQMLGGRRFLTLMFSSGILGGVFQVLVATVWPALFDGSVVGASACAFGLVATFALMFPERELTMLIFFIPVHLRAKTLLMLSAVIALMGIIFPWDNVANAAHLGGMAMGCLYVKFILKNPAMLGVPGEERYERPQPVKVAKKEAEGLGEGDVDAVLDKISARGISSLTARERAVLEAARKKMAQP